MKNLQDVIYRDIESGRTFTPSITKSEKQRLNLLLLKHLKNEKLNDNERYELNLICNGHNIILLKGCCCILPIYYSNKKDYEARKNYNSYIL